MSDLSALKKRTKINEPAKAEQIKVSEKKVKPERGNVVRMKSADLDEYVNIDDQQFIQVIKTQPEVDLDESM